MLQAPHFINPGTQGNRLASFLPSSPSRSCCIPCPFDSPFSSQQKQQGLTASVMKPSQPHSSCVWTDHNHSGWRLPRVRGHQGLASRRSPKIPACTTACSQGTAEAAEAVPHLARPQMLPKNCLDLFIPLYAQKTQHCLGAPLENARIRAAYRQSLFLPLSLLKPSCD